MIDPAARTLANLSNLTSFTGQPQAAQSFAQAATDQAYQTASLQGLLDASQALPATEQYQPMRMGQGKLESVSDKVRETYRQAQETEYTKQHYGVIQDDYKNLIEYKDKVDTYREMGFLSDDATYPEIPGGHWILRHFK